MRSSNGYIRRILRERILSRITEELTCLLPTFDPYSEDRQLLHFVYRDLQATLNSRYTVNRTLRDGGGMERLMESEPEEFDCFLKVWVVRWLDKWRERVMLFSKRKDASGVKKDQLNEAKKIFADMKRNEEFMGLIVKKLISRGEVCMVKLISENLLLDEICCHLSERRRRGLLLFEPNPIKIFQRISKRIDRLTKTKEPLIYLRLRLSKRTIHEFP